MSLFWWSVILLVSLLSSELDGRGCEDGLKGDLWPFRKINQKNDGSLHEINVNAPIWCYFMKLTLSYSHQEMNVGSRLVSIQRSAQCNVY